MKYLKTYESLFDIFDKEEEEDKNKNTIDKINDLFKEIKQTDKNAFDSKETNWAKRASGWLINMNHYPEYKDKANNLLQILRKEHPELKK